MLGYLRRKLFSLFCAVLLVLLFTLGCLAFEGEKENETPKILPVADATVKWVDFTIPCEVLEQAYQMELQTHLEKKKVSWIELLAYFGAKYGGNFSRYKAKNMTELKQLLESHTIEELTEDMKYYAYYHEVYQAVLGGFVGEYAVQKNTESGAKVWEDTYGLKVYSPIASGFYFEHYDDFNTERTYGYQRKHLGHDLMCSVGTPIIAVESGVVEELGWNQYGGWRIGIRSFDRKRYYYYAHMRQNRPYHPDVAIGSVIRAGDVIGYVGKTGYSTEENYNGMSVSHLHWGMELIFDEAQKDGENQIWIDLYEITKFLNRQKSEVYRVAKTKEFYRKFDFTEPKLYQ